MIRCKACGYVMKEGKLGDRCPACGAPRTFFEPYIDNMSPERRNLLKLELHPIATHFPVALIVIIFMLSLVELFLAGTGRLMLAYGSKILVLLLPIVTALTFGAGWLDGTTRFRKIANSRILKVKIVLASVYFIVSLAMTFVVWLGMFNSSVVDVITLLLSLIGIALISVLGLLGASINDAAFPGK
jgi:uncharacterized membrane protein